jgi:hypothetical protein
MNIDIILVLLVAAVVGLALLAPTVEGIEQKDPSTTRPSVSVSLARTWTSPVKDQPRPYTADTDCKKIAGNLAGVECADPDGNPLA